jgi:hypothetical protein
VAVHYLVAIEQSALVAPLLLNEPPPHSASLYEHTFPCPGRCGLMDSA